MLLIGYVPTIVSKALLTAGRAEFSANIFGVLATVIGLSIAGLLTAEQLDLERMDRSKDRRLSAKHAVLMDAIRGLNKMIGQVTRLANIETEHAEIAKSYGEGFSQAAPGLAVAELDTVAKIQKLTHETGYEFMTLTIERFPLVAMFDDCETQDKVIKAAHADNSRYFQMQTEATGAGRSDDAKRWSDMFRTGVEQMPKMREQLAKSRDEFEGKRAPYFIKCLFVNRKLRNHYRSILTSIRVEIEVDADEVAALSTFNYGVSVEDRVFIDFLINQFPKHRREIIDHAQAAGCDISIFAEMSAEVRHQADRQA